jgi:hypothetical protein
LYYEARKVLSGSTRIFLAISKDGINFVKKGVVITLGSGGQFDEVHALGIDVVYRDGYFWLYYIGYGFVAATQYVLGLAISKDGINFVKKGVVLPVGASGQFDDYYAIYPSVIYKDGYTWLYYSAYDGSSYKVGLSLSKDGINFLTDGGNDVYAKSLLHMNGADESTVFTDSSSTPHIWTANGNAQIDTSQSVFGGASGLFDGTGDYIDTPYSADFDFGTEDFTWDFRIRFSSVAGTQVIMALSDDPGQNYNELYFTAASSKLFWAAKVGNVQKANYSCSWSPSINIWYHIAIVRSISNFYMFIDAVSQSLTALTAISTNSITPASPLPFTIGREGSHAANYFFGWQEEVRISKGIARWTANFTLPLVEY